jgi:transcription antitermination factor NusG
MTDSTSGKQNEGWLVVWTMPRAEKQVASRIGAHGIEVWLPTVRERHRWSDRWREVVLPLFPGYLFARAKSAELHRLLRTPGVLTVVKSGDRPALLSDSFIASLRGALNSPTVAAQSLNDPREYAVNDEVVVQEGPLAGLRGVVQQFRGARQVVIWVREIGRGVAFTMGATLVSPAAE